MVSRGLGEGCEIMLKHSLLTRVEVRDFEAMAGRLRSELEAEQMARMGLESSLSNATNELRKLDTENRKVSKPNLTFFSRKNCFH